MTWNETVMAYFEEAILELSVESLASCMWSKVWPTQPQWHLMTIATDQRDLMTCSVDQLLIYSLHDVHPNITCWPWPRVENINIWICFYFQELVCIQTRTIRWYRISACLSAPFSENSTVPYSILTYILYMYTDFWNMCEDVVI